MSYVYVASSWRNPNQPFVISQMRQAGIDCYDFRNPSPGNTGFSWRDVGGSSPSDMEARLPLPKGSDLVTASTYMRMINHPVAIDGFNHDFEAMQAADTFVLLLPCGKSAHLELGWAVGFGKRTAILLEPAVEPELMYRMVDHITTSLPVLIDWVLQ